MLDAENTADNSEATPETIETTGSEPAAKAAKKAPAKKAAAKKTAAKRAPVKKAAAKKTAAAEQPAEMAPAELTATAEVPETTDGAPAEQAAAPAAKRTAKKAAAKKAPAKKAAAKRTPAKKVAAAEPAEPAEAALAFEIAPAEEAAAPAAKKAPAIAAPLFQPPDATKAAPRRKRAEPKPAAETEGGEVEAAEAAEAPAPRTRTRRPAAKKAEAQDETEPTTVDAEAEADEDEDSEEQGGGNRRRRRRGGRRRRRSGDNDGQRDGDESGDETAESAETQGDRGGDKDEQDGQGDRDDSAGGESSSSRRRRRRRRTGDDGDGSDDPENTVTRVRKPRVAEDEITALHGSTRLEAKKQRRREGREAGRRRAPIVSEAEFLARREAVDRVMVIRQHKDLTQIAVLEDKVLVEHYVARESQTSLIGNVYLGRVQNVLPSMEAAFIDIGKGRNAVLYAGEVNWDSLGAGNGPRKIEQVLKSGQPVLVQVTKDPIGHKGARLTSQISLPGRFLVYVPDGTTSGISRKLPDTERTRLKNLLKEIVPDSAGVIVRTAAEGASEDELTLDVERLTARWADIESKVEKGNAPALLYGEPDLTLKVVRDLFTEDFGRLVVSGDDAWDMVENYVGHVAPDLAERLERYDGGEDVFAAYRIDEQIAKALDRKVWLPSGGSLVIDRTEAMTVVDVNTGKFTGSGGNLEETVTKNNLEAAEEIVRQLRLRDIGGIIVVDFIDMVLESNRDLVLRRMVECLGRDRTRHQVAEVTSLGLVQMTRKRIGTGLLEAFSESCEPCQGRGLVIHHEPVESRKKAEEEPRRNRRGRGRGDEETAGGGNGATAPSPKDIAAMARAAASEAQLETVAEEIGTTGDGAAASSDQPDAERAGSGRSGSGRADGSSRRSRGRGGRSAGADRERADLTEQPEAAAGESTQRPAAAERPEAERPEPTERPGAAEPERATEPVRATESVESPESPERPAAEQAGAPRTRTRSGRGSSRREAGPPTNAPAAAPIVVTPTPEPLAESAGTPEVSGDGAPTAEPAAEAAPPAPRVVTSSRRRVARRPAGPPVGGPGDVSSNGTGPAGASHEDGDAEDGSLDQSGLPDDATTVPAHVPVKKKGSRKR